MSADPWTIRITPRGTVIEAHDAESERAAKVAYLKLRTAAFDSPLADRIVIELLLFDGQPAEAILTLRELGELLSDSSIEVNRVAGRI